MGQAASAAAVLLAAGAPGTILAEATGQTAERITADIDRDDILRGVTPPFATTR